MSISITLAPWMLVPGLFFALCVSLGVGYESDGFSGSLAACLVAGVLGVVLFCLVRYLP